jgi:hypothetical protein
MNLSYFLRLMQRRRSLQLRGKNRKRRLFFRTLSLVAVFAGLWFSAASANLHATPYLVGKDDSSHFRCYSGPKLPVGSVMRVVPSEPFGRLGNVFLVFIFAVLEAWQNSCHLELPDVLEALPGWRSNCKIIYNARASSFLSRFSSGRNSCGVRSFADFGKEYRTSNLLDVHAMEFSFDILGLYTETNETHAYGKVCDTPHKLALHLRSGDIVKGYFSSDGTYIQQTTHSLSSGVTSRTPYTTAFYLKVIERLLEPNPWLSVRIYTEDTFSPSYVMLHPLKAMSNTDIFVGRPLFQDVQDMTCSSDLASSRGSFLYAVTLRYKFQRLHFQSDSIKSPYRCHMPNRQGYYLANDTAYIGMLKSGWENSVRQRDIINRDFSVKLSQCERCTYNADCIL